MPPLVHPGVMLLEEMLERDWSLTQTANAIGADREQVRDFLMSAEDVTPEFAKQLEAGTGIAADYWLRVQARHDAAESANPLPAETIDHATS
ncbi:MAG: addiction module antidote protein HigA family [Planctomycetaceae bacterium]|nr:addiction module antidote protein HigA family [Planctomycetaceae bacterium]